MRRAVWLAALLGAEASAQVAWRPPPPHPGLPVGTAVAPPAARVAAAPPAPCDPGTEGARFEVEYTGFPARAEAAFQAAVDTWACLVRSPVPIRVAARWASLERGTLGSAGPLLVRDFDGAPSRGVWYPAALADALVGRDLGPGRADVEAVFNSDFGNWHVGPGPAPESDYDLRTVVLHELGHGLGLIGGLQVTGGVGVVGRDPRGPYAYDLHTRDGAGNPLLDGVRYPSGSVALAAALESAVGFGGRAVEATLGAAVPLYAPPQWVQGGSYSHLDEDAFAAGTPDGLMTPFIARGETIAAPGPAVCAVLADVGWPLAGACAEAVGPVPPAGGGVEARLAGPNPFRTRTRVRLASDRTVAARAVLFDVLGRRVADLGVFALGPGAPVEVAVAAGGLGAGVYVLRVTGGPAPLAVPLTVAR